MFPNALPLMRIAGFDVRLDWSWFIVAILITWTLASGVFPSYYPGLDTSTYWSMGVLAAIGLFASIVLHEVGHSVVARRHGLPIKGITLFVFGGVAEMGDEPQSPKVEFLVAIGGPVVSFALALGFAILAALSSTLLPTPILAVLSYLASINAIVAIFNLVPAFPLDGGRILRAALWHRRGSLRWATSVTSSIGAGFGLLLIALGVYSVLTGNLVGGMWWFLIGLFVRSAAKGSYQQVVLREGLRGVPVRRLMSRDPHTAPASITVQELVDNYIYRHQHKMLPVVEGERPVGCISVRDIRDLPREEWPERRVADIMRPCAGDNTVSPDTDALDAIKMMNASGNGRLLVTENERLVGVVTIKDMLKFLSIKLDLEGEGDLPLSGLSAGKGLIGRS